VSSWWTRIACAESSLQEADAGDFASDDEIATVFNKWQVHENLLAT